jgi:hypothetical protein
MYNQIALTTTLLGIPLGEGSDRNKAFIFPSPHGINCFNNVSLNSSLYLQRNSDDKIIALSGRNKATISASFISIDGYQKVTLNSSQ